MINFERVPFFHCAVLLPKCIAKGFCDIFTKEDKVKHLFSSNNYWSSTTHADGEFNASNVNFNNGKYKKAKYLDSYEKQRGKMSLEEIKNFYLCKLHLRAISSTQIATIYTKK